MLSEFPLSKRITLRKNWFRKLGYEPRRGQAALYAALDQGYRYLGYFAFPRGGKSFGAARAVEPYLLLPDVHVGIVAPTYALGSKEFGYIWTDLAEQGVLKEADVKHYDMRGGNMYIRFPWGSFCQVLSADNIIALRGEEWDILIMAES